MSPLLQSKLICSFSPNQGSVKKELRVEEREVKMTLSHFRVPVGLYKAYNYTEKPMEFEFGDSKRK
jgi:hypothetical protein